MAVRWQKITMSHSYVLIYVDPRDEYDEYEYEMLAGQTCKYFIWNVNITQIAESEIFMIFMLFNGSQKEMRTEAIEAITSILNDLIGEQDIRQQNNTDTNTNSTISFQKELSIFVINIVFK